MREKRVRRKLKALQRGNSEIDLQLEQPYMVIIRKEKSEVDFVATTVRCV